MQKILEVGWARACGLWMVSIGRREDAGRRNGPVEKIRNICEADLAVRQTVSLLKIIFFRTIVAFFQFARSPLTGPWLKPRRQIYT
jgi:hypothetical protein